MYAVIALALVCVFLCQTGDKKRGLKWSFIIITTFLAIRYDWGNDYLAYLDMFKQYAGYGFGFFDFESSLAVDIKGEVGWVLINRLFNTFGFGFFGMVIVITIFENYSIYHIIKKYVEPRYYWVAIIFYILPVAFCINASMMRQYFCMCLYVLVFDLMNEKRVKLYWLWSIVIIFLGGYIHKSFWFMAATLPLYFIHFKASEKVTIWPIVLGLAGYIVWDQIGWSISESSLMMLVETEEFESYDIYLYGVEGTNGAIGFGRLVSIVVKYIMFVWWLILLPRVEKKYQTFMLFGVLIYLFDPIVRSVYFANRVQSYLDFVNLLRWPLFLSFAYKQKSASALYVGMFALQVVLLLMALPRFYLDPNWINKCFDYHTIFSAGSWM